MAKTKTGAATKTKKSTATKASSKKTTETKKAPAKKSSSKKVAVAHNGHKIDTSTYYSMSITPYALDAYLEDIPKEEYSELLDNLSQYYSNINT